MHKLSLRLLALFVLTIPWVNIAGWLSVILLGAALGCTLVTCVLHRRIRRPPALFYFVVGLLVWQLATYYWSIDPSSSLARARLMLMVLTMVWMITELSDSERDRLLLAQSFVLGGLVLCGVLFYAYFAGETIQGYRNVPSYLSPNDVADVLAAGVATALLIIGSRPRKLMVWVNIAFVPLAFVALLLTASRSGFIITCLAALGVFFLLRGIRPLLRLAWVVVILAILAASFLLVSGSEDLGRNLERMTLRTETYSLETLTGRTTIWAAGAEQFKEHPIIGVGAGSFRMAVRDELGPGLAAHNVFIEAAVETGVIGLCFFVGAFAAVGWPVLRRRDRRTGIRVVLLLVMIGTCLVANVTARYSLWFVLAMLAKTGTECGARKEVSYLPERPGVALAEPGKGAGERADV